MDIEVELSRIIINEKSDQQFIVLKEKNGERRISIVIGIVEAFAIDRKIKGFEMPRPMTHELLQSIIHNLGAGVEKITVTELRDQTFFAVISLKKQDSSVIEIDARPSDAIALATSVKAPIFVNEEVLNTAS